VRGDGRWFCRVVHERASRGAQADFEQWLADNDYPSGSHGGVSDTSEMIDANEQTGRKREVTRIEEQHHRARVRSLAHCSGLRGCNSQSDREKY
jgi:hypothetical protein